MKFESKKEPNRRKSLKLTSNINSSPKIGLRKLKKTISKVSPQKTIKKEELSQEVISKKISNRKIRKSKSLTPMKIYKNPIAEMIKDDHDINHNLNYEDQNNKDKDNKDSNDDNSEFDWDNFDNMNESMINFEGTMKLFQVIYI